MGDTFDKVKQGIKETADKVEDSAEKVVDPDTYTVQKMNRNTERMKEAVTSQ